MVEAAREAAHAAALAAVRDEPTSMLADSRASALYDRLKESNAPYVQQLRVILQSAEAREKERAWLRLKSNGELDETRLVDAAIGERQVFKQRGKPPQRLGTHQSKPKHLAFLLDASMSMARGDPADGRLRRMGATAALLMEALHGFEHKFVYSMSAHSGSTGCGSTCQRHSADLTESAERGEARQQGRACQPAPRTRVLGSCTEPSAGIRRLKHHARQG